MDDERRQKSADLAERLAIVRERLYWTGLRNLLWKLLINERLRARMEKEQK